MAEKDIRWNRLNSEKKKEKNQSYYEANKERIRKRRRERYILERQAKEQEVIEKFKDNIKP